MKSAGHSVIRSVSQMVSQSVSQTMTESLIQLIIAFIHLQSRSDSCLLKVNQKGLKFMSTLQTIY